MNRYNSHRDQGNIEDLTSHLDRALNFKYLHINFNNYPTLKNELERQKQFSLVEIALKRDSESLS